MKPAGTAAVLALAVTLLAGCSAAGQTPSKSPAASGAGPTSAAAPTLYSSTGFAAPLSVELDPSLDPTPIEDSAGLLTWAQTGSENRIRILIPAKVYNARNEAEDPGPYPAYLQTLVSQGARFSHEGKVTIDGQSVPIRTVNAANDLVDGDIGCSSSDTDQSDPNHCFAFGPDFSIRVVTFMHAGKTIVAWARTSPDKFDKPFNALFEKLLATIKFD